jgi:hypothetical protein
MTVHLGLDVRNAMLAAVAAAVEAGSGAGFIELRDGEQPATCDDAATGTLLAVFTLASPAFGTPVDGVMDLDASPDLSTTALANGFATWARVMDSDSVVVFDGAAGAATGLEFSLNNARVDAGTTVVMTVGALTMPA